LCGREFIVGLKLPGNDYVPGGIGPVEAATIASRLTRAGDVDYVCFAQGRARDIRYCVWCNLCWDTINTHLRPIACVNNPRVAKTDEVDWWPQPSTVRRRVVVVGTGVAGMEAAWIAAARGHDVTVFGIAQRVGGGVRLQSLLPGGEPLRGIYEYQLHALFDRVVVITPRESIAQKTALVTRQGIVRRCHEKHIETIVLAEPRWAGVFHEGRLEYANVYNGDTGVIPDVAFFAYSTPRVPEDTLAGPLRAAGIETRLVGDCRAPGGLLAATSDGHAAGNEI